MKTSFLLHRKSLKTQKIFFGFTSSFFVIVWGLLATLRRLLSIIGFFTPSLGLFNTLNHWLAEQYLFTMRTQHHPLPIDQIQLFNMTQEIKWLEYDRATYEFPAEPAPPSYNRYTGFCLQYTLAVFLIIMAFQVIAIALVKHFTSEEFAKDGKTYNKARPVNDVC